MPLGSSIVADTCTQESVRTEMLAKHLMVANDGQTDNKAVLMDRQRTRQAWCGITVGDRSRKSDLWDQLWN